MGAVVAIVLGFVTTWWAAHDIEMIALGAGWAWSFGFVAGRRSTLRSHGDIITMSPLLPYRSLDD